MSCKDRSHDHFYTLDALEKAKNNLPIEKVYHKHFKAIVSVHLEKLRTKCMYLTYINTGICLSSYTDDISIEEASPNPDGKC